MSSIKPWTGYKIMRVLGDPRVLFTYAQYLVAVAQSRARMEQLFTHKGKVSS